MSDALIVGATGLVGRAVVGSFGSRKLTIVARREVAGHCALVAPPVRWGDIFAAEKPSVLISCLGTTIRQAGSQAAFRAVDHDLIMAAAQGARAGGASHMIVVSSVGASAKSNNFYLRTKGETEEGLGALGFDRLDILRPGLLTGNREGPARLGEGIAMVAAPLADLLMRGSLRRYRSISATTVVKAIVALTAERMAGTYVHENDAMQRLAD